MSSNIFYKKYGGNVHSQNGEDGVTGELLRRLGITGGYVCEFGAWDGKHLSNTFHLIQQGFSGVFIEGDPEKYKDLLKTCVEYPKITPVLAYVDHVAGSPNTLDALLMKTDIPIDFEVLSIDIDSYDYQVWKSVEVYKPKLVIIEIHSGVDPLNTKHIHAEGKYMGTGFMPTFILGAQKGYTFLLHTGNMFFIRNDLYEKLDMPATSHLLENFCDTWYSDPRFRC